MQGVYCSQCALTLPHKNMFVNSPLDGSKSIMPFCPILPFWAEFWKIHDSCVMHTTINHYHKEKIRQHDSNGPFRISFLLCSVISLPVSFPPHRWSLIEASSYLALWVWRLMVQNITRINYHLWILVVAKSMFHLKIPDIVIFVRPFDVSTAEVPQ